MNDKDYNISFMKVFGILIVILGHSLILYQPSWNIFSPTIQSNSLNIIKSYIDIFQIPLFVSISGYLFYYGKNKYNDTKYLIKQKSARLLIPFTLITLLWVIPIRLFINYSDYKNSFLVALKYFFTVNNIGHTWFMFVLFFVFILFNLFNKKIESKKFKLIIFISIYIISIALPIEYQIKRIAYYLIFFYLGYLVNEYKKSFILNKNKLLILLFINITTWVTYFILSTKKSIVLLGVNHIVFLMSSVSIIIVLYSLFAKMDCKKIMSNKFNQMIEKNNFGLYLFHEPIIYIIYFYLAKSNINPFIMVVLCFIISSIGSILITNILRKLNLKLIIGE